MRKPSPELAFIPETVGLPSDTGATQRVQCTPLTCHLSVVFGNPLLYRFPPPKRLYHAEYLHESNLQTWRNKACQSNVASWQASDSGLIVPYVVPSSYTLLSHLRALPTNGAYGWLLSARCHWGSAGFLVGASRPRELISGLASLG